MEFIKSSVQVEALKILRRRNFKIKITGRSIAKFSRGGASKPKLQAKRLQAYQGVKLIKPSIQAEILQKF